MDFKKAIFRFESDDARNTTMLELKRDGQDEWTTCFEYPRSIDFAVHTYISSGTSAKEK